MVCHCTHFSAWLLLLQKREPGHETAYNLPFTVRRLKDSDKNGRYNVSLYRYHGSAGPRRLIKDYNDNYEQHGQKEDTYEKDRITASAGHPTFDSFKATCCACGLLPGVGSRRGITQGKCFYNQHNDGESRRMFFQRIKQAVLQSERREVVVFIHGYNVKNEAALKSAAQFVFDSAQDYTANDYPGKFVYKRNQR